MLNDADAVTHTLFGKEILVNGYFTSVLGMPALNMGVFVGIISGFAGGVIYNKYYNYRNIVYAVLQGCVFAMAGIIHLRVHSFGNLEFITRIPMSLKAGLAGDVINFVICVVVFFVIGYFVAYFMIGKFKFATPGRLGNYTDSNDEDENASSAESAGEKTSGGNSQAERIITLLGGRENIVLVDACMTRLRVTVKDLDKVAELPAWKAEGALGLIKKDNGIQAVYGPKADVLKSDINDIL